MKKHLKKWLPQPDKLRQFKSLQIFGNALYHPNLWHLNRRSVPRAFSVGCFCAFVPMPFQMVLSAAIALLVRSNLPLSIALVWISNPLTIPPLFYFTYRIGSWAMGIPPKAMQFQASWDWLSQQLCQIWQPLLLGCAICAISTAILSNVVIRLLWRFWLIRDVRRRKRHN